MSGKSLKHRWRQSHSRKSPRKPSCHGLLPPDTTASPASPHHFHEPSSLSCAIDCRGSEIIESHSLHTPTRILE